MKFIRYHDLDNHIRNVINQLKKWKKRADVDAISNQIVKINNFVDININFLADCSNYLLKRKVIVKKIYNNRKSYSLNENDKHLI